MKLWLSWSGKRGQSQQQVYLKRTWPIHPFLRPILWRVLLPQRHLLVLWKCRCSCSQMFFRSFSYEYCKVIKSSFFIEQLRWLLFSDVLFYIIISKRRCWIYCSFILHNCFILKPKITLICFHSLYHRCHPLLLAVIHCHSLSFVVTCYHSLLLDVPLVRLFIND